MKTKKVTTRKKMPAKKRVIRKAQPKSAFEMLEGGVLGKPIKIVNKTFLASLGLVSTMQTEFTKLQSDFEKGFEKLVKDGEKARDRYRAGFRDFRDDVSEFGDDIAEEIVDVKDRVVENLKSVTAN